MKKIFFTLSVIILSVLYMSSSVNAFEKDVFKTSQGDLAITFIGHGTLMMEFNGKVIHVDPVGQYADYSTLPKADLILVTHEHGDHLDLKAIELLAKPSTVVVLTKICAVKFPAGKIMANEETASFQGLKIDAVPAYNIIHKRGENMPYHPKGAGNGYVITFGDIKVYVAGDTENIPEMANLKNIDIAFLPMNLPYTMTPVMVSDAARMFKPKILYPYHFGNTNTNELVELLKNYKEIEVRIRKLQ
jgi:L-ascorbate metabolism protein UlaG (beta-lactamase superfamily)